LIERLPDQRAGNSDQRRALGHEAQPCPGNNWRMTSSIPYPRARSGGFTLIELMITVAIVAILSMVALPTFFDSIRKGRRADAIGALSKAQQAQERFRANNAAYGDSFTVSAGQLAVANAASATFDSGDANYTIDITANTSTGYTLLALAKSGTSQAKDANCQCLELAASAGQMTYSAGGKAGAFNGTAGDCGTISAGAAANRCWRK
jgi:type IV pilus assembly protein PilE